MVIAVPRSIVGAVLPATRREGRVIGLVGVVIVAFTNPASAWREAWHSCAT
jgi:hypothetical protein